MAGITLAEAQAQLDLWLAASRAVASGQEYSIDNRKLRRADAAEIRNQINYWQEWVNRRSRASSGGGRFKVMRMSPDA